jgi:Tol biopolymer transport system component
MKQNRIWLFAAPLIACTAVIAAAEHVECKAPISTIAFVSSRVDPTNPQPGANWEIWLMNGDGTNQRRVTVNTDGDGNATLSPDGEGRIVFDSNRDRAAGEPANTSDLFLMNQDGTEQTRLTRGSSATWSPKGKLIAFHRSASFTVAPAVLEQLPIRVDPGAPAFDSDIFVAKVKDLLKGKAPENITNTDLYIEDDADWSPDGKKIAFTRHRRADNQLNSVTAEICVMDAKGKKDPVCYLTFNGEEERAPDWSPDSTQLAYMCRKGGPSTPGGLLPTFEICVINADGTGEKRLTTNTMFDGTPQWSPDGQKILFSRGAAGMTQELWLMNADGTVQMQFTDTAGFNGFGNWGEICAGDDEEENEDEN